MKNTTLKTKTTFTPTDIYQEVTDTIISQLENGTVPWHNQWLSNNNSLLGLPYNHNTGVKYRGINILLLWTSAIKKQYNSSEWATLKQWNDKKEFVRAKEKGHVIVKYDTYKKEVDGQIEEIPYVKKHHVFNRCQLASYEPQPEPEFEHVECLIEKIDPVEEFLQNTGVTVQHGNKGAFYNLLDDTITMPFPELFVTSPICTATEGYYSTLLHETTHWTGAKGRLNRFGTSNEDYAKEELVAELGAAFLCAGFEIATIDKGSHATYIEQYLKMLKDDKKLIFKAASQASKAVDYLYSLQPE